MELSTYFKQRPGFNTTGKAIQVAVNSYPVIQYPNVKVFQYDVGSLLDPYSWTILTSVRLQSATVLRSVWSSKRSGIRNSVSRLQALLSSLTAISLPGRPRREEIDG
jgi:hypothetical protein